MLRTFAAVLLATSLVAGTAFAAEPTSSAGSPPAATATGKTHPAKPGTLAKHTRKHLARVKHRAIKTVHHGKGVKTHKSHVAKSAKPAKTATSNRSAGVNTARLPAARSGTN